MVKVCCDHFPKGSLKAQQSSGFYMDGYLKENLDIMAERIVDDMQFVAIVSGKGTVRNGKSTFAQQQAYYFTYRVNQLHKLNNKFTIKNVVFKADHLIERAFALPKYSVLVLDEGDDLTAQYYSKLAIKLRRFFRKCGQLNLFFILLIPDYFELSRSYAVTRSTYLVNVMFQGKFQRGFFEFYSADKKRDLYYKGRRFGDYKCVQPDFQGRFPQPYLVDEKLYREKKLRDMIDDEGDETTQPMRKIQRIDILKRLIKYLDEKNVKYTQRDMCRVFDAAKTTISQDFAEISKEIKRIRVPQTQFNTNLNQMDIIPPTDKVYENKIILPTM